MLFFNTNNIIFSTYSILFCFLFLIQPNAFSKILVYLSLQQLFVSSHWCRDFIIVFLIFFFVAALADTCLGIRALWYFHTKWFQFWNFKLVSVRQIMFHYVISLSWKYSILFIFRLALLILRGGRITGDNKLLTWPSKNVYCCRDKSKFDIFLLLKKFFQS